MIENEIVVSVKEFRAIHEAEIILDGITIVAGENGSGKSSLSKLLYNTFKSISKFDLIVKRRLLQKTRSIRQTLDMFYRDLYILGKRSDKEILNQRLKFQELISTSNDDSLDQQENKILYAIDFLIEILDQKNSDFYNNQRFKERVKRLENILISILKESANNNIKQNYLSLHNLFDLLKTEVHKNFNEAYNAIENRPFKIFYDSIRSAFPESKLPRFFEVLEYGSTIISNNNDILGHSYLVQNVAYIDTPMSFGIETRDNKHWADLNSFLKKAAKKHPDDYINDLIKYEILNGDVSVEQSSLPYDHENYLYKRSDGSVFDLLDCATGIKSFAIIQLLLKNGFLSDKTLLIIDEPEAHLHPQWIIEYARLIVILNKKLGVKFFIASHNPDMVSAIKYIGEKYNINEKINFYLSERNGRDYTYSLRFLGNEIEEIFASFNIALERINLYGNTSE